MADRPPCGRDREASRPFTRPVPRHCSKSTRPQGNASDLRDILEDKARQSRSIYGSRGRPTVRDDNLRAGHSKSGRDEQNRQSSFELRRDIAQYRGAAHPLCFTDEVMDHQIPEGFKPVNIESYDGTTISSTSTWPAVTIFTPSNISTSSLKDQPGIGLTACQQSQLGVGKTWKPHFSITSKARMCDHQPLMT